MARETRKGMFAILAILAALGSFVVSCTWSGIVGLILAIVAVPLGVMGFVMAASPRVTGGIMSIAAIILAVIAMIVAALAMLGRLGGWAVGAG